MWVLDSIAQEIVWSNEILFDPELDYGPEDDDMFDSCEHEDWGDNLEEDRAMEGFLFGWDA